MQKIDRYTDPGYDEIDRLIDEDPIELGRRYRKALADIELGDTNSRAMYSIAASYGFEGESLGGLIHRMGKALKAAMALIEYRDGA